MDPKHPTLATTHEEIRAEEEAEVARAARAPQLRTREDQIAFIISTIQWVEKNITDILLNQKSLERIVETKFHDLDIKVIELTTTVNQLKHEDDAVHTLSSTSGDDDDTSIPTTTQFRT
ncbi:pumilio-like protein 1 [Hordeum vulgare]|nr:pumilio-like protein 1 [Hordeum vulgare]